MGSWWGAESWQALQLPELRNRGHASAGFIAETQARGPLGGLLAGRANQEWERAPGAGFSPCWAH